MMPSFVVAVVASDIATTILVTLDDGKEVELIRYADGSIDASINDMIIPHSIVAAMKDYKLIRERDSITFTKNGTTIAMVDREGSFIGPNLI